MNALKTILGVVAPTLATALGGPLAGGAVKFLAAKLLGNENATADVVLRAVQSASPETLSKIKEIDANYNIEMKKLDIDLERISAEDRNSARKMQISTKSIMPGLIALAALTGFFGILIAMVFVEIPPASEAPLQIMLGTLGALVMSVGHFYFGSSAGSKEKTEHLAKK